MHARVADVTAMSLIFELILYFYLILVYVCVYTYFISIVRYKVQYELLKLIRPRKERVNTIISIGECSLLTSQHELERQADG